METIDIRELFSKEELKLIKKLKKAKLIYEQVVKDKLSEINKKTGQENDGMYISYALEYLHNK